MEFIYIHSMFLLVSHIHDNIGNKFCFQSAEFPDAPICIDLSASALHILGSDDILCRVDERVFSGSSVRGICVRRLKHKLCQFTDNESTQVAFFEFALL